MHKHRLGYGDCVKCLGGRCLRNSTANVQIWTIYNFFANKSIEFHNSFLSKWKIRMERENVVKTKSLETLIGFGKILVRIFLFAMCFRCIVGSWITISRPFFRIRFHFILSLRCIVCVCVCICIGVFAHRISSRSCARYDDRTWKFIFLVFICHCILLLFRELLLMSFLYFILFHFAIFRSLVLFIIFYCLRYRLRGRRIDEKAAAAKPIAKLIFHKTNYFLFESLEVALTCKNEFGGSLWLSSWN